MVSGMDGTPLYTQPEYVIKPQKRLRNTQTQPFLIPGCPFKAFFIAQKNED
jgi:hypothetical protein